MKNKIFLSSMLIMSVAPAMAEPSNTGEFPSGGLMQEDYTYTNAATSTNMDGVYEGSVNATAEYEDVLYQIAAGQYLPAGAESPIDCNQSGYFCAGVQNGVYYDANNNQGLTSCSTATNGAYTLSAGTGDSVNSCYRTCTNNDVAHSTGTMNGGYYYGDNNQCEPTDCVDGWHVKSGLDLMSLISANEKVETYAFIDGAGVGYEGGNPKDVSSYGISDKNSFVIDYGSKGSLMGHGRCSTRNVEKPWSRNNFVFQSDHFVNELTDETGTGTICYCKLEGYTPAGKQTQPLSSPWMFNGDFVETESCTGVCANYCAYFLTLNYYSPNSAGAPEFRAALFGAVQSGPAMCEANVININWSNADAADISANNAGTATYGSDVRTPVKAQTIKGKTFKGWRFSKPTQTTTGN